MMIKKLVLFPKIMKIILIIGIIIKKWTVDSPSPRMTHIHTIHNNDMILTWSILRTSIISDFTHKKNTNMEHSKNINNI